jgi:hypothetical protein
MPVSPQRARLSAADWRLLAAALAFEVLTALAIRTMPLPAVRARLARLRPLARVVFAGPEHRVLWAVEATSRRIARLATCLVKAMVAELALASDERPLRLHIGVRAATGTPLQAHAWLADRDQVLVGGPAPGEYTVMAVWDSVP